MRIPDQLRRLAHRHFDRDEVASLRSLLSLLAPYLKAEWQVVDGDDADLVLVRLDAPAQTIERNVRGGPRAIACVRRPREALVPAIHRPLRAYEILTVLNEAGRSVQPQPSVLQEGQVAALAYWPIEFEDWPSAWSRVLAAIAGGPLRCGADRSGDPGECRRCGELSGGAEAVGCVGCYDGSGGAALTSNGAPWAAPAGWAETGIQP